MFIVSDSYRRDSLRDPHFDLFNELLRGVLVLEPRFKGHRNIKKNIVRCEMFLHSLCAGDLGDLPILYREVFLLLSLELLLEVCQDVLSCCATLQSRFLAIREDFEEKQLLHVEIHYDQ